MAVNVRTLRGVIGGYDYPNGDGWAIREDGSLDVLNGSSVIATHAPARWDAVRLRADQGGSSVGPVDPPRPANHHPVA